jgi:hydrogenase/urease accessory protein HupE
MGGVVPTLNTEAPDSTAVLRFDTRARFLIGLLIIAQFVLLVGYVVFSGRELPDSQLILGAEIGFVVTVLNYFFGSSSGSVMKSASKDAKATGP